MTTSRSRARALALGALAVGGLGLEPASAGTTEPTKADVTFAPHRAIYELSIERTLPGSGVTDVNGRIVYELTGNACEGYTQNMRFVTVSTNAEGASQTTDLRTSSWEQVTASKLRFSASTYQDEQLAEQSRGVAVRNATGGPTAVDLSRPTKKSLKIDGNARFPMQHSIDLIKAARAGRTQFASDLFDGSESGEKVYSTFAVIGRPSPPGAAKRLAKLKDGGQLDRVPSWPVSISYFLPGARNKDEIPVYEMSYRFHDNGVTSELRLDYGDYVLRGELKELAYLDTSPCASSVP